MSYPVRSDPVNGKRLLRAGLLCAAAMLCVLVSLGWTILSRPADAKARAAGGPQSIGVCCSVLLVLASVPYVFYARLRLGVLYRCPQCNARIKSPPTPSKLHRPGRPTVTMGSTGGKLPPHGADRRILHNCDVCRITWDTGWRVGRPTWTS
jgi:hypothetical protein